MHFKTLAETFEDRKKADTSDPNKRTKINTVRMIITLPAGIGPGYPYQRHDLDIRKLIYYNTWSIFF